MIRKREKLKLGFVGTFHPRAERLGTASTGMVALLSQLDWVSNVTVFGQIGATMPEGSNLEKVSFENIWDFDNPISLIRLLLILIRRSSNLDRIIFNTYLTAFGRSDAVNGLGLLLPCILRTVSRKSVIVYMHNFLETEHPEELGYEGRYWGKVFAGLLERLLSRTCDVVAPLESQITTLKKLKGMKLRQVFVPYVEALPESPPSNGIREDLPQSGDLRILLFGFWGPQKDLETPLSCLSKLVEDGHPIKVVIAGSLNPNFLAEGSKMLQQTTASFGDKFEVELNVPFSRVPHLFRDSDILILPYNSTGGYSGVLNVAAYYGLKVIAYDLDKLRETAALCGADVTFVLPHDRERLRAAILALMYDTTFRSRPRRRESQALTRSRVAVSQLARP